LWRDFSFVTQFQCWWRDFSYGDAFSDLVTQDQFWWKLRWNWVPGMKSLLVVWLKIKHHLHWEKRFRQNR
jgi:hypothetical protein